RRVDKTTPPFFSTSTVDTSPSTADPTITMAFKLEAFQNKFLPPGKTRVDSIITVTADATVRSGPSGTLVIGFIIDKSGSMAGDRIASARGAVVTAISQLPESAWFFIVAFDSTAQVVVSGTQATPANRLAAAQAIQGIHAGGGTAMSTGLAAARSIFERA